MSEDAMVGLVLLAIALGVTMALLWLLNRHHRSKP